MPNAEQLIALHARKNRLIAASRTILDRCTVENRGLSRRERAEIHDNEHQIDDLATEIRRAGGSPPGELTQGAGILGGSELDGGDRSRVVLAPEERMSDWASEHAGGSGYRGIFAGEEDPADVSLGKLIRGMVTGSWRDAELEQRALVESTDSAGGFLTPEPLAARFIDRIRNATQVMAAGAQTVPMTSDTLSIPRLTGGATVAFKTEGNPITPSDMAFDRVTFTARTLPILVKLSRELFEDMQPEAAAGIEAEIAAALGLELDRVALRGSGTPPEPRGVRNQSGVTIQSLGASGATPTWDSIIDGVTNVRNLNVEPNALIWASRTAAQLGKVKESTGAYVQIPPIISGVRRLVSNQVPVNLTVGSSSDCSEVFIGDWTQCLVGIRTDLRFQVRVLEERFADSLEAGLLAYLRADVQLQHPEAFNVMTGVRP